MEKGEPYIKTETSPGILDTLILKALGRDRGAMRDYGIDRRLRRAAIGALQGEEGPPSPAPQRLAIHGRADSEWATPEKIHRARFYKLTPAGRKDLRPEVTGLGRTPEAMLLLTIPAGDGAR
jgi:DNA-binding PadR family transcriptional regulator